MDGIEEHTTVLGTGEKSPEFPGGGQLHSLNVSREAAVEITGRNSFWGISSGENRLKFLISGCSKGNNWLISYTLLPITSVPRMDSTHYGSQCHK